MTFWGVFVFSSLALSQDVGPVSDLSRLRALVAAGAAPRAALDKALAEQADRDDEALLRSTLYGSLRVEDLSEPQAAAMVAAARRRLERVEKQLAQARPLVEQGIAARNELAPLIEESDSRAATLRLAEARAQVFHELLEMTRAEADLATAPAGEDPLPVSVRFDGNGVFHEVQFRRVQQAYEKQFNKPLPVSAYGETVLHRSMGFDHRGRVDLALNPDLPEGVWLRQYLEKEQIPYFMFRAAVPGSATGPHFHLGPPSLHLRTAD